MEKISDSVAVEAGQNGGGTTIGAEIEAKEPIAVVEKKENDEASKNGKKKKKTAGVGQKKTEKKKKKLIVISAGADDATTAAVVTSEGGAKGCRVQVSNTKKPLFFYLNVAKRYIKQNNYVELSALGMAIPTVVTISEILKKDGWATEKKIGTSTVTLKDEAKGRIIMKAKIEILLERCQGSVAMKSTLVSSGNELSESNEKLIVKKNQSETEGTLTEKKETQNTNMKQADGGKDENVSVEKAICGEVTQAAVAAGK